MNHVIWQCRKYEEEKKVMDAELVKRNITGTEDVLNIIEKKDWMKISVIFNFVKKIKRII